MRIGRRGSGQDIRDRPTPQFAMSARSSKAALGEQLIRTVLVTEREVLNSFSDLADFHRKGLADAIRSRERSPD